jgi:hypothetical protein
MDTQILLVFRDNHFILKENAGFVKEKSVEHINSLFYLLQIRICV